MKKQTEIITILGVGNILLTDEGFGVHVIRELEKQYNFPKNVQLIDGGVLGLNLLNIILESDRLIVVDVIRSGEAPGTLYRIDYDDIPNRIKAKNSLHQLDFIESLTKGAAIGDVPYTIIIGTEPKDIETHSLNLTLEIEKALEPTMNMVLSELDKLQIKYMRKTEGK